MKITREYIKNLSMVPRSIIFFIDIILVYVFYHIAFFISNGISFFKINFSEISKLSLIVVAIHSIVFILFKTYAGIVRYTGFKDALRIFLSLLIASTITFIYLSSKVEFFQSFGTSLMMCLLLLVFSLTGLVSYRLTVKYVFYMIHGMRMEKKRVIVYGASNLGVNTKKSLDNDSHKKYIVVAFIDDNVKKHNKFLDGIPIYPYDKLTSLLEKNDVDELIIASKDISSNQKNTIIDLCLNYEVNVLTIPNLISLKEGVFNVKQLRKINIEELLEREPIEIHNESITEALRGKSILVTGAAGSIGSEIVRQLIRYSPSVIIMCDQAETPLHLLELNIASGDHVAKCITFLGDIRDETRMRKLFSEYRPNYVYHAAAYKHVPMMEMNPVESIKTNVFGTKLIADLSIEYGIERFVMVSTDKAVNPTNVMGASKRMAEMYVQALSAQKTNTTKFITTRFGNVLGSNGSVILRFKEQIESGSSVTVTHPNITRYFMTIPEACQLVLEAGCMGNGGEIFVFDMGDPVKIVDLAKKMIRLYNFIPNVDIPIVYTGLRPGEKLYEELLNDGENCIKTYHEKIMIAKVKEVSVEMVNSCIDDLVVKIKQDASEESIVLEMKKLVPEFVSKNSDFSHLDKLSNYYKGDFNKNVKLA